MPLRFSSSFLSSFSARSNVVDPRSEPAVSTLAVSPIHGPEPSHQGDLPTYSDRDHPALPPLFTESSNSSNSTSAPTEHRIELPTAKDRPWLWMTVRSEAPSLKSLPVFVESPIVGRVEMDLVKPGRGSLVSVTISVRGTVIASGVDSRSFFELSQILWHASMGDPNARNNASGESTSPQNNAAVRLCGRYSWPFTIQLPREITLGEKTAKDLGLPTTSARLPPTLLGRAWHAGITYTLVVDVKRAGVFNVDRSLPTTFGYIPPSAPDRPSRLREISYLNGTTPPGPAQDPEGWTVTPEVEMHGTAFKQRKVVVKCELAFAKPLAYTRGSVVPLFLTLRSADEQLLDILAHPYAPIVQMRKKIKVLQGVDAAGGALAPAGSDAHLPLSRAQWWKPNETNGGEDEERGEGKFRRTLMGEMTLPRDLTPSFSFGKFDLKYVVDIFPFHAAGFEPAHEDRLARTEVIIHPIFPADSPRPRAYLPPGYVSVQHDRGASLGASQVSENAGFL